MSHTIYIRRFNSEFHKPGQVFDVCLGGGKNSQWTRFYVYRRSAGGFTVQHAGRSEVISTKAAGFSACGIHRTEDEKHIGALVHSLMKLGDAWTDATSFSFS